jgi:hypothetical protein
MNAPYATSHDQAGRHSRHAIYGRHSGEGRRYTLAVPGWTVIQVYGHIQQADFATFQSLTEDADPATTLVTVTGPGGNLAAGIGMGLRIRQKKLIVGVMSDCTSSCALMWIGGETGRKFVYHSRPVAGSTELCFHQASEFMHGPPSAAGNAAMNTPACSKYGCRAFTEISAAFIRRTSLEM